MGCHLGDKRKEDDYHCKGECDKCRDGNFRRDATSKNGARLWEEGETMLFIISPAKKMVDASDSFAWRDLPRFLPQARELLDAMRGMAYGELKDLWACSDALAELNHGRVMRMDLGDGVQGLLSPDVRDHSSGVHDRPDSAPVHSSSCRTDAAPLTPAVFSYEGIQYQNMAPQVMTDDQLEYLQAHLRILSGFYGVLRPLDGVTPYRLEMQAKLAMPHGADGNPTRNLYEFWGSRIYEALRGDLEAMDEEGREDRVVVNLASVEYAKAVEPYAKKALACDAVDGASASDRVAPRYVTCLFGSMRNDKFVQRSTEAKAARGTFVRWCAENKIVRIADFPNFNVGGYRFDENLSDGDKLVFVR